MEVCSLRCRGKADIDASYDIRTVDAMPIKKNPYCVPYALQEEMKNQLDALLQKGVNTP
jgi:hypothetical protein